MISKSRPYLPEAVCPELLESFKDEGEFMEVSADLMKLVIAELKAASGILPRAAPGWKDNDAILMGMMVRLYKLGRSLYDQVVDDRLEIAWILSRCLYETSVRLRYLIKKNDPIEFEGYLLAGSESEVRLKQDIEQNIAERGGRILPIEERMLTAVRNHAEAGFLDDTFRKWRDCRKLGLEIGYGDRAYRGGFQIPSLAVHGFASDLFRLHLEAVEGGYYLPSPGWTQASPQILITDSLLLIWAMVDYIEFRLRQFEDHAPEWLDKISRIETAIRLVDHQHEMFVQNSSSN